MAIVFVGYSSNLETEGNDRADMDLPDGQDELIQAVVAANKKTIVVFNAGDSVGLTKWIDRVPGLIDAWYGGEEGGNAIADVLLGVVNPSGKLPFTFLRKLEDSPSHPNYPGKNLRVKYAEGIYVGYRYFDKHEDAAPLYPFGFGLSYTKFALSKLELPKVVRGDDPTVAIRVTVENTGVREGAEVVQLYVGQPNASVDRPVRELKGFERVELVPGESRVVTLQLDRRSLSFYSIAEHGWVAEPGQFDISVGSSIEGKLHPGTLDKSSRKGLIAVDLGARYRAIFFERWAGRVSLPVPDEIHAMVQGGAMLIGIKPRGSPNLSDDPAKVKQVLDMLWTGKPETRVGKGRVFVVCRGATSETSHTEPAVSTQTADSRRACRTLAGGGSGGLRCTYDRHLPATVSEDGCTRLW